MSNSKKHFFKGAHQSIIHSNRELDDPGAFGQIFLLLHGYSESGDKMMKRVGRRLEKWAQSLDKKILILAPNGLYPMPKSFPLGSRETGEDLLQGFAWYFYDQTKDEFLIDYKVPAQSLSNLLIDFNPGHKPVTIIGYSQGGDLAPFIGLEHTDTERVIGLNCSYRVELFESMPDFQLDQIQAQDDTIIDTKLCHARYLKLKEKGISGEFYWIPDNDHRLSHELCNKVIEILDKGPLAT